MSTRRRKPALRPQTLPGVPDPFGPDLARLEKTIVDGVSTAWQRGWMPSELLSYLDRTTRLDNPELVAVAIVTQRRRAPAAAHPSWLDSFDEVTAGEPARSFAEYAERHDIVAVALLADAVSLDLALRTIPGITVLCPPPGSVGVVRARTAPEGSVNKKVLARIRALLAKAEATPFAEEAQAFTAKAQQQMSDHSIERALLDDPDGTAPAAMRIWHDAPYASQKATLLGEIAHANACRAVWNKRLDVSTVFGFDHDLASVELLHTSLLVQANTEMSTAVRGVDFAAKRVRSFRASFLIGFAVQVGERLEAIRESSARVAAESTESDLLPVLASRDAIVEGALSEAFPNVYSSRVSLSNGDGYRAGTIAANKADIGPGGPVLREAG